MAARCIIYTQQVLLVCVASSTHSRCILYAQQVYPVRTAGVSCTHNKCIRYAQQVYPVRTTGVSGTHNRVYPVCTASVSCTHNRCILFVWQVYLVQLHSICAAGVFCCGVSNAYLPVQMCFCPELNHYTLHIDRWATTLPRRKMQESLMAARREVENLAEAMPGLQCG